MTSASYVQQAMDQLSHTPSLPGVAGANFIPLSFSYLFLLAGEAELGEGGAEGAPSRWAVPPGQVTALLHLSV